jgi:hypothetical protein
MHSLKAHALKEAKQQIQVSDHLFFSRPRRSQGLLYKQPSNLLINSLSQPFPPPALWRRHALTLRDSTSSYKIDSVIVIMNFPHPKGHQNLISGSKVTAILLKGWILPIGGASSGRVCACSLHSRLVFELEYIFQ